MFAVIKTGGKQYLVQKGDTIRVEKLLGEEGSKVAFDAVLMKASPDGKTVDVGTPNVKSTVEGTVVKQGRAKKVDVVKYKSKTRYKKQYGHRQHFTEVKITTV
ncbi:MAG: 50S ribosomal protein L21 [Patescibacteria group bacterium]